MVDIARIQRLLDSFWLRRVLPLAIVVLCLAGVAVMLLGSFGTGVGLWGISLILGALTLFARHKLEKKLRDLQEEEAQG